MSINKKEFEEKINKYVDTKFPSSIIGYDPCLVDLLFDEILVDYKYLMSYSLRIEELNKELKEENVKLKDKIKELESTNKYLKNRVSLKRNNELNNE